MRVQANRLRTSIIITHRRSNSEQVSGKIIYIISRDWIDMAIAADNEIKSTQNCTTATNNSRLHLNPNRNCKVFACWETSLFMFNLPSMRPPHVEMGNASVCQTFTTQLKVKPSVMPSETLTGKA